MTLWIIHSHNITEHWEPNKEYRTRLAKWAEFLTSWKVSNLILTWGKATPWIDKRHCDSGKEWFESQWIQPQSIHVESDPHGSLETVWEMVFARKDHEKLLVQAPEIAIISSDYHINRLWEIASFVLWREIRNRVALIWVAVDNPRSPEQEEKSLQAFRDTFHNVPEWNLDAIIERLWKSHGLYKNHPSNPYS